MIPKQIEIRMLSPEDAPDLGAFFELLACDLDTQTFFHPHPLTQESARAICLKAVTGRDRYFVARWESAIIGYSMLRGWDEGYAVPSFGGCVHPELRSAGIGGEILKHAIQQSKQSPAPRLRLTVYKQNAPAIRLYRNIGFEFSDKNDHELIGILELARYHERPARGADLDRIASWFRNSYQRRQFIPSGDLI